MFERTLQDLIRGLRAHKASSKAQEDAFLSEAMTEIRDELQGKDMALKAEGVVKMCYVGRLKASCQLMGGIVDDAVPTPSAVPLRVPCCGGHELCALSLET